MAAATQASPGAARGRDLDGRRLLAGLGALALLISLFLDWYGQRHPIGSSGGAPDVGITAWTSFELIDILFAALALATLAWVIDGMLSRSSRSLLPSRLGTVAAGEPPSREPTFPESETRSLTQEPGLQPPPR